MGYQRGKYIKYFAKMKIRVGGANSIDIQKGDEFEYDGSILKYSGMEVSSPQLRGAIENGWANVEGVVEEESEEIYVEAVRPSRSIAKSQTINRDLSKVQRTASSTVSPSSLDEDEVLKVSDRETMAKKAPKILKSTDNRKTRGMEIQSDSQDNQDAVSIGRVRTSAKAVFNDVNNSAALKKIQELENLSGIRADLYENKVVKEGVTITSNLGRMSSVSEADPEDGEVVGRVRNSSRNSVEGISVADTSGIRNPTKKAVLPSNVDPRIRIARAIDPDFPLDWSFSGKLVDRLQAVKDHGVAPSFLEALFAAEGDQMRKILMKEFPDQFNA